MRVIIAAVGTLKSGAEWELFQRYLKPVGWNIAVREISSKRLPNPQERMEKEADSLLSACEAARTRIALDERGKSLRSLEFASYLRRRMDSAQLPIAFIIGGADGLSPRIREHADLLLSFGTLSWPHMLVRAMLAEQLYRAHSILSGHPYHRE